MTAWKTARAGGMREVGVFTRDEVGKLAETLSQATSKTTRRSLGYMLRVLIRRVTATYLPPGTHSMVASQKMERGQLLLLTQFKGKTVRAWGWGTWQRREQSGTEMVRGMRFCRYIRGRGDEGGTRSQSF